MIIFEISKMAPEIIKIQFFKHDMTRQVILRNVLKNRTIGFQKKDLKQIYTQS